MTSPSSSRNARWGLILFFIYLVFYMTFMGVNTFAPDVMSHPWWSGVNLAIWSGMGLIAAAFILALIYLYHASDEHEDGGSK